MSIPQSGHKRNMVQDTAVAVIIVAVGLSGFALGRLSGLASSREPVEVHYTEPQAADVAAGLVASRYGQRYYYPWCSGVGRIDPENLITFPTPAAARAAGYTPAQNCAGLE